LAIAAKPPRSVNPLRPKAAARALGLDPSVRAAVARFRGTDSEYWLNWCSSGAPYQTYAAWLDILKQDAVAQLASIWNGRSDATDSWFQETCAPAIEKALAVLVKQRIAQARDVDSKRLEKTPSGNPILNEILAGGANLSPQAQEAIRRARIQIEEPGEQSGVARPNELRTIRANGSEGAGGWQTIEISFLSDERVQIRRGTNTETFNYGELGFADLRVKRGKPKPNQAWITLRAMAQQNGIIPETAKASAAWPKIEKRVQEIRKALRKHVSITADPIPFVDGTGYQACFKIGCSPSFQT
jgi:hypothetical protein